MADTPDGAVFIRQESTRECYCPKCKKKTLAENLIRYSKDSPIGKRFFIVGNCMVCHTKVGSLVKE
jgi:hypothetical protein